MNESTEQNENVFIYSQKVYDHITKLPWIGTAVWTALFAWVFRAWPAKFFLDTLLLLYLFGISFNFISRVLADRVAARYRRKVLLCMPDIRPTVIQNLLKDADVFSTEAYTDVKAKENED